jgi:cytochrome c oxidase subunit 1
MTPRHFPRTYLNHEYGLKSWLLTKDHKRIGLLYWSSSRWRSCSAVFFAAGVRRAHHAGR